MDGKIGLKNPTGFMLKRLVEGVIREAEYQIKRSKELSERMQRDDSVVSPVDYKKALREKKEKEEQEGMGEVNNQRGNERKFYPELVEAQKAKPIEQRQNLVELSPYRAIWQIEGYKSRDEYDKAIEKAQDEMIMRKLLASVKTS